MNTQEYIASGILEAYVLGALPAAEAARVRDDIARYPELAREVAAIEEAMFRLATAGAVEPPAGLQDKIWSAIEPATVSGAAAQPTAAIIPLNPAPYRTRWNMAAVWVGLIVSIGLNAFFWYQNSSQKQQVAQQAERMNKMADDQKALVAELDSYHKSRQLMADTGMQTIVMHTIQPGHPMAATLYWSKSNGEAYVSIDALPEPPKGMQYQLWVMQSGKPVDMGTLPVNMASTPAIRKVDMKVMGGEAFAISLEKEGGSPVPTMQNIYVMGKPV